MARPSLTQEEIDRFRSRLCEAAIALFATQGYEAVTMRAIAEHTGPARAAARGIFASFCSEAAAAVDAMRHSIGRLIEKSFSGVVIVVVDACRP